MRSTHENFDGAGYPDGLLGTAIPIEARIISVCDAHSSMTSDRSYRPALSQTQALAELARCAGTQFDPTLVGLLTSIVTANDAPSPAVDLQ